jgi:hypothetical protein
LIFKIFVFPIPPKKCKIYWQLYSTAAVSMQASFVKTKGQEQIDVELYVNRQESRKCRVCS